MRKLELFIGFAGCALCCTGCENIAAAAQAAKDPNQLLFCFAILLSAITVLLVLLGEQSLWEGFLNALRYTGVITMAAGPLYGFMMKDTAAMYALLGSGALAYLGGWALVAEKYWRK